VDNFAVSAEYRERSRNAFQKPSLFRRLDWHVNCSSDGDASFFERSIYEKIENRKRFYDLSPVLWSRGNWVKAGFWLAIGFVFLIADNLWMKKNA
jgi:hypothetical protein